MSKTFYSIATLTSMLFFSFFLVDREELKIQHIDMSDYEVVITIDKG